MKILLTGDSITDMGRDRNNDFTINSYGAGYSFFVKGELDVKYPGEHTVINRGIGGNRSVDLYARIKSDCIQLCPDVVSVLIGVNDIWHEINWKNGLDISHYKLFYSMFIDETKAALPDVKFMMLEPFVLRGLCTEERFGEFSAVYEYAAAAKQLAEEKNCVFVPLQARFDELAEKYGSEMWLYDGVHPAAGGAKVIADAWLEAFYKSIVS